MPPRTQEHRFYPSGPYQGDALLHFLHYLAALQPVKSNNRSVFIPSLKTAAKENKLLVSDWKDLFKST